LGPPTNPERFNPRWKRLAENRSDAAKSVFQFDVQGSVANSTHSGLPWLLRIRRKLGPRVHFWPFDGWEVPAGRSAIVEVYPRLFNFGEAPANLNADQRDAFNVAAWLAREDRAGRLLTWLKPALSQEDRERAQIEGWILGVE